MDCVVTGGNVKVLAKAIHSLSRIGEELYLEPVEDGLALRSVNSSRSAFACFLLSPLFFQRYQAASDQSFRCKMPIKSVQAVFKSLASLERSVEKCRIQLNSEKSRLTITLHCKHGLLKTHNLSFQDCESLQAVFDKESCANVLQAQPRLMVDTVLHFPPSLDEVNLSVSSDRVWLRNHVEDDADSLRAMMTELCLSSEEFDHFAVGTQTSVTFCLKELRGLLVFAESSGLPVSMYFDEPGSPVILSVTDSVLEANFVLATLSEDSHPKNHVNSDTKHPDTEQPPDDFMSDDMDSFLIAMETSELPGPSHAPASPPRPSNNRKHSFSEEEALAEGPPNKKFCSLFFGSVLPTPSQLPNQTMQSQEVLASDSEDENQTETS
ncbi:cell cycle checkpoint control protein RAD9A isoform X2 [Sinocyclocheilus grahami]|uniref:Cell cycle checkpoint control protein n=1 Tax=Sinocyclocheilus grahami TaxID=75366 RepID=A0A672M4V7_SINGR|nr:PREDICTED: cell cycle checkpoint control protein RAD9A isoform X1 [Sinocyclocheilus grahami]XP_016096655.1 PREDICTED: cell cycle checkpoint control protein RAD9A isoform X2 [Sinocyclocheilus grahami]